MVDINSIYLYKIAQITNKPPLPIDLSTSIAKSKSKKHKSPELERIHNQFESLHIKKIFVHAPNIQSADIVLQEIRKDANKGMDVDAIVKQLEEKYHIMSVSKKDADYFVEIQKPISPQKNNNLILYALIAIFVVVLILLFTVRQ